MGTGLALVIRMDTTNYLITYTLKFTNRAPETRSYHGTQAGFVEHVNREIIEEEGAYGFSRSSCVAMNARR